MQRLNEDFIKYAVKCNHSYYEPRYKTMICQLSKHECSLKSCVPFKNEHSVTPFTNWVKRKKKEEKEIKANLSEEQIKALTPKEKFKLGYCTKKDCIEPKHLHYVFCKKHFDGVNKEDWNKKYEEKKLIKEEKVIPKTEIKKEKKKKRKIRKKRKKVDYGFCSDCGKKFEEDTLKWVLENGKFLCSSCKFKRNNK